MRSPAPLTPHFVPPANEVCHVRDVWQARRRRTSHRHRNGPDPPVIRTECRS